MDRLITIHREFETAYLEDNRPALEDLLVAIEARIAEG
jgi:hypothetical protein